MQLQQMLHRHNHYVKYFKTALERMPTDEHKLVIHANKTPVGQYERRYNAPEVNEVAIIIIGNDFDKRDIVIQKRNDQLKRVLETLRSYSMMHFSIQFSFGKAKTVTTFKLPS